MTWQAITLIVLTAISGTVTLIKHGEPTKFNFGAWVISTAITMALLYTGGFFG